MLELFRFPGGVKPASHKQESSGEAIRPAPLPAQLVVPFRQSATGAAGIRVAAGDKVLKGQLIGAAEGPFGAAVHAPTSGSVVAIEARTLPHPSGLAAPCAIIEPDGEERWGERLPMSPFEDDLDSLRTRIREAGLDRVHIGLDYFDASINRVAAWVIGTRNAIKALLLALLEPSDRLRALERDGDSTGRLALIEELKTLPFGAVWDSHCARMAVPVGFEFMTPIRAYERTVLAARG